MTDEYFSLFSSCIVVHGAKFSIIQDLERDILYKIDKDFGILLLQVNKKSLYEIQNIFNNEFISIKKILDGFVYDELGLFHSIRDEFPSISKNYLTPSKISNAIIQIRVVDFSILNKINFELQFLGCKSCEIWFLNSFSFIDQIEKIIEIFRDSKLRGITIYIINDKGLAINHLESLIFQYPRINGYVIFDPLNIGIKHLESSKIKEYVLMVKNQTISEKLCGIVSSNHFRSNVEFFVEANNHNSCLNRKISIDAEGNIKNCPSMTESFGNIRDTTLAEAIEKPGFKKYWDINKDKIHVCKDCEFRYICTDCRAYVEDPEDILSKPLKCGYNPYTGEWSEWSTNPMKQKAIDFYGMREMVDDMNKAVTGNT